MTRSGFERFGGVVRIVEGRLGDADVQRLFSWAPDVFGLEDYDVEWQPKDVHFLLDVGAELVSHVGIVSRTIVVEGAPVRVAGVGAVVTHGEHHGKGYASALVRHVQELFETRWGVRFGMLFCREPLVSFYSRLGWQIVRDEVTVDQPVGKVVLPFRVMCFRSTEAPWPRGRVDLCGYPW